MNHWLITMGDFASSDGIIVCMAPQRDGSLRQMWTSRFALPADRRVAGKGFTGAVFWSNDLIVAGFNGLYRIDSAGASCEPFLLRDDFNDLHDVSLAPAGSTVRFYVANTGLDCIVGVDEAGATRETIPLVPAKNGIPSSKNDPYFADEDRDKPVFLQKLRDTVHPNAVQARAGDLWVSRFADRCIERIGTRPARISVDGCPHDLVFADGWVWFTTTDGRVWRCAEEADEPMAELVVDTFGTTGRSGWVRGLALGDDGQLLLGFTRISRMPRERWTERPFASTETGILVVDITTGEEVHWESLEALGSHPKVFSIIRRPEVAP